MSYANVARRLRLPMGFLFGTLYLACARPTLASLALGGAIALVGVLIRGWAAGHIVKNQRLATTGPYAHTRNPLYFGSFLIAVGFALAAHWSLLIAVAALFLLIYRPTIERERENISGRFPQAYPVWEANVPAFVPRITPWRGGEGASAEADQKSFSFALYLRHGEWKALLVYSLAVLWFVVRMRAGV